jgi:cell division protein FtsL
MLPTPSLPVVLILAAVIIGVAALLPLVQSSGATSTEGDIRRLEQQNTDWRARVRALELEVAGLGSLNRIEQEATQRLKMAPPKQTEYIRVDAPGPEPHRLPSRYLPPSPALEPGDSSLLEDLFGWIPRP